jgi:2-succinyl-6-hydroxy-2,4-cyclohexadiene-1-carboxylate synthase
VTARCRLVALHGFLGQATDWDGLAEGLPGCSVAAIDLWAVLDRSGVDDWGSMAGALEMAIANALDGHDERPAFLVAYSFGARLALSIATSASRDSLVQGACLVSCHPGLGDEDGAARAARRAADSEWSRRILTWPVAELWRAWDDQPVFTGSRQAVRPDTLPAPRESLVRALTRFSVAGQPDFRPRLRASVRPLLWMTGGRDAKFSAIAGELASGGVPATFVTCEEAGHRVPWDNPPEFARAVQAWLARVTETPR